MGYVRGGETLESWCAVCTSGPGCVCYGCDMDPGGPSLFSAHYWECEGCSDRKTLWRDDATELGGDLYCHHCLGSILRGVEVARAQGITVTREPASDYYRTLINLAAMEAACKGGDE